MREDDYYKQAHDIVKWNPRSSDVPAWHDRVFAEGVIDQDAQRRQAGGQHATSEQFHSEFKTDLDLRTATERHVCHQCPVMALGTFIYSILRFLGQTGLIVPFGPMRHSAKRQRLMAATVIHEFMYLAARLITVCRL